MSLISLVVTLILVGVLLYVVSLIPMDGTIRRLIQIVVIVVVALWLIQALGLLAGLGDIRIGR